jgi:molybdopterin-guanine dinucleotide biosynthesis protein A
MGVDKASLDAGGVPLALRPVQALRPLCGEVVLAGRPVIGVDAPAVPDVHPGCGPLAGLLAGITALTCEYAVVVGCDMPEVEPGLVALLLELLHEAGPGVQAAVCAAGDGRLEPLPVVLRTAARRQLRAAVGAGGSALREGLAALATMVVAEPDWRPVDPGGASFENWNQPSDIRPLPPGRPGKGRP